MKKKTLSQTNAEAILAFADGNMRPSEAARIMHVTPFNISYHLDKVKSITGLDPRKFYELAKLMLIAKKIMGGSDNGKA